MLQETLYRTLLLRIKKGGVTTVDLPVIRSLSDELLKSADFAVTEEERAEHEQAVYDMMLGLGPLEPLMRDESVTEIMVNGPGQVFIERQGQIEPTSIQFLDEDHLLQIISRIVGKAGRRIDESSPLVDARLEDGSRINAIIPPLSLVGPVLTIRKFPHQVLSMQDLLDKGSLTHAMANFLKAAVHDKKNCIISGGTGTGKTSTLNALCGLISQNERIITIEDSAEIKMDHPHRVALESRMANLEGKGEIAIRTLLKNALRMRPDRIVVGEIRGGEALDMLQAMNTGHRGSLSTVHANSPLESLYRIETMVLMGDVNLPLPAVRAQIVQGIDLLIQMTRLPTGERRITQITEIEKAMDTTDYHLKDLFKC